MKEFKGADINLMTINTPVRSDYQLNDKTVDHLNIYDTSDPVQVNGGNDPNSQYFLKSERWNPQIQTGDKQGLAMTGEFGPANRTFNNAVNIQVNSPQGSLGDFHNSHNRVLDWIMKIPDFTLSKDEN
jgi:hypothetical protein